MAQPIGARGAAPSSLDALAESAPAATHFQIYVAGGAAAEAHWRLLSGNHRERGRSATPVRTAEDALLDIKQLLVRLEGARTLVRPAEAHRWEWRLVDDDGTLAVSGHAFDRKLRCVRAAEQFRELAPLAAVARNVIATGIRRGPRTVRSVGRRA